MKRYCPKCGKEITDENSINNFCIDCYMQEHKIIQIPEINISICVKCGKIKFQGKYYNNKEDIEKIIQKNIKVNDIEQARAQAFLNLDLENNKNNYILVIVQGLLGNKITQIKQQIPINLKKETCVSCSRTAGKYYTTILQIRFNDKETQEKMESEIYNKLMEIINNTNENTADPEKQIHLTKNVTQKNGFDLYLDNARVVKNIVKFLSKHKNTRVSKPSQSLVGVDKSGQRMYRYTYCVHFGSGEEK